MARQGWIIVICIAIFLGTTISHAQNISPMELRSLIEQTRQAWVTQDPDALAQIFAPNGVLIVPGAKITGREAIRAVVRDFAENFQDVKIEIRQIIVEGDRAAVEWYYEDTEIATGKRNRADDAIIVEVENNLITRWREYFDTQPPFDTPSP